MDPTSYYGAGLNAQIEFLLGFAVLYILVTFVGNLIYQAVVRFSRATKRWRHRAR